MMKRKYLASHTACKLYDIKIGEDEVREDSDWSDYLVVQDIDYTTALIAEIRSTMERFKDKCKWTGDKRYFYVTTGYASHFKNMHVIMNIIKTEEAAKESQPYNYFENKADADQLLEELKNVFIKFGFSLEKY